MYVSLCKNGKSCKKRIVRIVRVGRVVKVVRVGRDY